MEKGLIGALALLVSATANAGPLITAVDPQKPPLPVLGAGEAMIVMRLFAGSMAGDNRIDFYRFDPVSAKVARSADAKPDGFRATFTYTVFGGEKGAKVLRTFIVPAGVYLLGARDFVGLMNDSFCFGAPRFTVAAGSVTYLGDYEMISMKKAPDRELRNAMPYSTDIDGARTALAAFYPAEAARLALWSPVNGTRFDCAGDNFTAYAVPGAPTEALAGH